jgi:hypothetical protein
MATAGSANVAAVGNLITVAWVADAKGSLVARAINLSGTSPTRRDDPGRTGTRRSSSAAVVSLRQGGYPVASASAARSRAS